MKRGLSRREAAEYIGISESKFADLVRQGRMPAPRKIDRGLIYDRYQIDEAFDNLPTESERILIEWEKS